MVSLLQKIISAAALLFITTVTIQAQHRMMRANCMPNVVATDDDDLDEQSKSRASRPNRLTVKTTWDASREYPVAVLLVSFNDCDFLESSTQARYDSIFNRKGYNEGNGPGCVADYFATQSNGLFKPRFDIFGPIKISKSAKNQTSSYGSTIFREATLQLLDSIDMDWSPYDWDSDGYVESLVFIYAGYGGNESADICTGCIWPNTSTFSSIKKNGLTFRAYSASAERFSNNQLAGIGTICHEFAHTLGLPDIYPTSDNGGYSVCDEWDLMDGGNFSNNGWCPCNFSAMEKMLLGWATPIELTSTQRITNMKSVSEGGSIYRISKTDTEYYLLENRQWSEWDQHLPGHGLVIAHVDYLKSVWSNNTLNNTKSHRRYELFNADGLDYDAWDAIIGNDNPYQNGHSRILSTTPYPFVPDDFENRELTDTSTPAAMVYSDNGLMGKPVTNIYEHEDGLISFDFMGGITTGVEWLQENRAEVHHTGYDLGGRRATPFKGLLITNGMKRIVR